MVVHEKKRSLLVPPTRGVSCTPAAEPVPEYRLFCPGAHTPSQTRGETPVCISKVLLPQEWGEVISVDKLSCFLAMCASHGSIIRYDEFEVFHFFGLFR
jgi:hypothetical protein